MHAGPLQVCAPTWGLAYSGIHAVLGGTARTYAGGGANMCIHKADTQWGATCAREQLVARWP